MNTANAAKSFSRRDRMPGDAMTDIAWLRGRLRFVRRRYRRFEAALGLLLLLAAWTWGTGLPVLLDMTLQLPDAMRWAAAVVLALSCAAALFRMLRGAVFVLPGDIGLAAAIERRFPTLQHRLLTALLASRNPPRGRTGTVFLKTLAGETRRLMLEMDLGRAVPWRRLRRPGMAATAGAVLLIGLRLAWAPGFDLALKRLLLPGADWAPPARTRLEVTPGDAAVPKHDPVTLAVNIHGRAVDRATLFIESAGQHEASFPMQADRDPAHPAIARFTYTVPAVSLAFRYRVAGGDARSPRFRIAVLERPRIRRIRLRYRYPDYLGRPADAGPSDTPDIRAPIGSRVDIRVEVEGDIVEGEITFHEKPGQEDPADPVVLALQPRDDGAWEGSLPVRASGVYALTVRNAAGLTPVAPSVFEVTAFPDAPPTVTLRSPDRNLVLHERAPVMIVAQADDDLGLDHLSLALDISGAASNPPPVLMAMAQTPGRRRLEGAFELPLGVSEDLRRTDRIRVTARARDRKGQESETRPLTITLTSPRPAAAAPAAEAPAFNELALLDRIVIEQKQALEGVRAAQAALAAAGKPDPGSNPLATALRTAFDLQKTAAGSMRDGARQAGETRNALMQGAATQHPHYAAALRLLVAVFSDVLETDVPTALWALSEAYQTAGGSSRAHRRRENPMPDPTATPAYLEQAGTAEAEALAKLEHIRERLAAARPGALDPEKGRALDRAIRETAAQEARDAMDHLRLAADRIEAAETVVEALIARQSELRDQTAAAETEQVRNLAESQDRLELDTGHADERMGRELPFTELARRIPASLNRERRGADTPPATPIPPVPPAPRKGVLDGPTPPMPEVGDTGDAADAVTPRLLIPDRFPNTFTGKLSDKPIPPPPFAAPSGQAPKARLRRMSDEEKAALRRVHMDALDIDDAPGAMGLGAPGEEVMDEEMLLQPGAQYSKGSSAAGQKPGMELGQTAGSLLSPRKKPDPHGADVGSQSKPNPNAQPPDPSLEGEKGHSTGSRSLGDETSTRGTSGRGSGSPLDPSRRKMQDAADALRADDRQGALKDQQQALESMQATRRRLESLGLALNALQAALADLDDALRDPADPSGAGAIAALGEVLNAPAWNEARNAPLSPPARSQLDRLRKSLLSAQQAMSGAGGYSSGAGGTGGGAGGNAPPQTPRDRIEAWAQYALPPNRQQDVAEGLREWGPETYQRLVEDYFRAISREYRNGTP